MELRAVGNCARGISPALPRAQRIQIQKEVFSDLKLENQFLSKEILESI
jgi:hypothetical protein